MKKTIGGLFLMGLSGAAMATMGPTDVPEPSVWAMVAASAVAGGIIYLRNRRK